MVNKVCTIQGTNGCLVGRTLIDCPRDLVKYPKGIPIEELVGSKPFFTYSWDFEKDTLALSKVTSVWHSGYQKVYRVALSAYPNGRMKVGRRGKVGENHTSIYLPPCELVGTYDHPVLLCDGTWKKLGELKYGDSLKSLYRIETERGKLHWSHERKERFKFWQKISKEPFIYYALGKPIVEQQFVCESVHGPRPDHTHVHHKDENHHNHTPDNLEWKDITKHYSDHLADRNRRGTAGWQVHGVHPQGMKGKKHSEEVKEQIKETMRAHWASKRAAPNHLVRSAPTFVGYADVYDMEVEGTSNFVANGVFVHNSGKTSIVYALLGRFPHRPIYGIAGPRYPEAYKLDIGEDAPLHVLGSYHTAAGGIDWIGDFDTLIFLLDKYIPKGHVLFEGLITSGVRGRVGEKLEEYGKNFAVLFPDTPLEVCIKRVKQRRATKGNEKVFDPKNLIKKFSAVQRTRKRYLEDGIVTVIDTSSEEGADRVLDFIRDAFECPMCHAPGATADGCGICGSGPAG